MGIETSIDRGGPTPWDSFEVSTLALLPGLAWAGVPGRADIWMGLALVVGSWSWPGLWRERGRRPWGVGEG